MGAFVAGSQNPNDWNWCDTKNCGRDGGQPKHNITINMSSAVLSNGDCGQMNKNKTEIYS